MKPPRPLSPSPKALRARAEQLLGTTRRDVAEMPAEDVQKLVHELQVHQIELEMQNEELRRTQLQLEQARDRYAELYDFAPVAHLTLKSDGEILEANLQAGELLGLGRDKLIHQKFTRFVAAEAQDACYLLCRQIFDSDTRQSAELVLASAQSERLVVQIEAVRDGTGRRKQCRFSFIDITQRKQAEAALRESSQFNHQIIADAKEGIIVNGRDLKHLVWNPFMEKLTGVPAAEVIGKHPAETFPFLREAGVIDQMQRALAGETTPPVEVLFNVPKSGRSGWALNSCSPLRNAQGEITGVISLVTDITERKQAEAALLARQAQLHSFVQQAPAALAMFDRNMNYLAASRRWQSDFHPDPHDLIGRNHYELHPDLPERWKVAHQKGLAGEAQSCDEDQWLQADGTRLWLRWGVNPWLDAQGNIGGIMILAENITARKQAEEALRQSEERLQSILDNSPAMIFLKDLKGRYLHFNRKLAEVFHLSLEKSVGKRDVELYPAEQAAVCRANDRIMLQAGVPMDFEEVTIQDDGPHTGIVTKFPLRDADGKIYAIGGIVTDITGRKQAEAALQLSEQKARAVFDQTFEFIGLLDPKGSVLEANQAAMNFVGIRAEQVLGRPFWATPWWNHSAAVQKELRAAIRRAAAGELVRFETTHPAADGTLHTVDFSLKPVRDARGRVVWLIPEGRDITERKRMEESLRRSEHNLALFFKHAPLGLEWLSGSGTILRANQAQLDLLGYAETEYVGHFFGRFCGDKANGRELLERLADRETIHNFRMLRRCKDGTLRQVLVDAVSFWNESQFQYSAVFLRDITDRLELEQEILQVSKREQQRIAQDLHDGLGQLLVGTAYLTSNVREKLAAQARPEAGELARILEVIHEAIAQTRSLARGIHPVEPEPNGLMVALQALAARTQKMFQVGCRFTCRQPVLLKDNAVATHLFRIAQEAVTNAIKHGKPRRIKISLTAAAGRITLAIKDNGAGLPARSRKQPGMGLRIMRYRAGMIGGSLAVQKVPAGGTAVICSAPQPGNGAAKTPAPAARKK